MKKLSKSLLLLILLIGANLQAWSQTSTQGKEFWVALVPGQYAEADNADKQKASSDDNGFKPYIAISAQKACNVRISNPNTGWSYNVSVNANEWKEIGKNNEIPVAQWYTPDAMPTSEHPYDLGLKVESTEDVSVYCSLRWGFSADATNILPTNALDSEYIVQTYEAIKQDITFDGSNATTPKTESNDFNGVQKNSFSVLAAEDCVIDIELSAQTSGGKSGKIEGVSLQKGQVYHVLSAVNQSLCGTRIKARGGKKIAVFAGAPSTRLPNAFSDRDLLYEQLFPIVYWGYNFVVVRSKQKDANRVIITAQEDNTTITIHGKYDPSTSKFDDHTILNDYTFTLNSGKSYEFEMSAGYADERWHKKRSAFKGITVIDSATYITASCPCAVISYDVGNKYVREDVTEVVKNSDGDNCGAPAMTWIAPIEQMMNDVVFGVMGTEKTTKHFINIIANTSDVQNVKLNDASLANNFRQVESNPEYSYARITLDETDLNNQKPNPFYHLTSKLGFIATVYGNGHNESYAYTAGSSTIKRAISVDGIKFTDNMIVDDILKQTYCVDKPIHFDPQIGTDIIDKVVWDFGDGTTVTTFKEDQIAVDHTYSATGWYDVVALVSAHRDCPYSSYPEEPVSFTIRVVRQDTIFAGASHDCIDADVYANSTGRERDSLDNLLQHGTIVPVPTGEDNCWDPVYLYQMAYGLDTKHEYDLTKEDSAYLFGKWYYTSQTIIDTIPNSYKCDSIITCHLTIVKCLNLSIINEPAKQHICQGQNYDINYSIDPDGLAGDVYLVFMGDTTKLNISLFDPTGTITVPTDKWPVGRYQTKILVQDLNCNTTAESDVLDFEVYYPEDIFAYKFNNVLAVYKKGYGANTGYTFTDYQWYLNGEKIDNATSSVYHTNEPFTIGDSYYVELTRNDGLKIRSCEKIIEGVVINNSPAAPAPAQKLIRNQRFYILKEGMVYDMYGQRVE